MSLVTANNLKQTIKTEALSLGFSHIGFCSIDPIQDFPIYLQWIEDGYAGDLHYLTREDAIHKRNNPKLIMDSAKSIISLAMPYPPHLKKTSETGNSSIASYAWEKDYHLRIPSKLEILINRIHDLIPDKPLEYRIYTDTGPLLERSIANQTGLGWIGKNSCLLIPNVGSYFFLAEILINIEFLPDKPFNLDLCGTCTRCIKSCPTNCILPNRTLDATRCISYLTIENRSGIDSELRESVGEWLFGCDICQQVCPWNIRFAETSSDFHFKLSPEIENLDPRTILGMEHDQFKKTFHENPLYRAKLRGLKRNAIVALGNAKRTEDLRILEETLTNETDKMLIELLEWAICRLKAASLPDINA